MFPNIIKQGGMREGALARDTWILVLILPEMAA